MPKSMSVEIDDLDAGDMISVRAGKIHEYIGFFTGVKKQGGMYAMRLFDGDSITYIPMTKIKWITLLEKDRDDLSDYL